jgi:predicted nucleic-acid-binding protein
MRALDTNILLRLMIQDDPAQLHAARALLSSSFFVPNTVFMETEWVLRSSYRLDRQTIADHFLDLLGSPMLSVENEDGLRWALGRFRGGADFADMIHIVASLGAAAFVTFDRALAGDAGEDTPVPVHPPNAAPPN